MSTEAPAGSEGGDEKPVRRYPFSFWALFTVASVGMVVFIAREVEMFRGNVHPVDRDMVKARVSQWLQSRASSETQAERAAANGSSALVGETVSVMQKAMNDPNSLTEADAKKLTEKVEKVLGPGAVAGTNRTPGSPRRIDQKIADDYRKTMQEGLSAAGVK